MSDAAVGAMASFLLAADTFPPLPTAPTRRRPTFEEAAADDMTVVVPSGVDPIHRTADLMTDADFADWPTWTIEVDELAEW